MGIFEFPEEELTLYTGPRQAYATLDFDDHLLFGYFFKDIVVVLLDKCGYEVYPYGYESFFPNLKRRLYQQEASDIADRIRCTPDLLVRNPQDGQVELVEVKARSVSGKWGVTLKEVKKYQQFWPGSILVLVIGGGNFFYAQRVTELPVGKDGFLLRHFRLFEEVFPLANGLSDHFRRKITLKAKTLFHNRRCVNL